MTASALDALRDVQLPAEPALWQLPQAWLLAGLAAIALLWMARRFVRRRPLRRALRELAQLQAAHARDGDSAALARGLSQLLRRQAAARHPQAGVEGLCGEAWLAFLDASGGKGAFAGGAARLIGTLPFQNPSSAGADTAALVSATHAWLVENLT